MQCDAAYQESVLGGSGDDDVYGYWTSSGGNACPRWLAGDAGLDIVVGGPGADWIYGGSEDDDLYGYDGYDRCNGGTTGETDGDYCDTSPSCNEFASCNP